MYACDKSLPGGSSRGKAISKNINERNEIPKLRKNRRNELRWGEEYFNALKASVFAVDPNPFVPAEIPEELRLKNEEMQPFYTCKHCNDSFRFKRSLDDHENRKSFVLGYWCAHCFTVSCTHIQEDGSMCRDCQNIQNKNRARLSRRGVRRGQKMGSVKIFYNQCQFFAHLKSHSVYSVEMTYLMMMPMPSEVENSEWSHLHDACKALMEYAFVKQKHVVDILRTENHTGKWWMSEPSDSSLVGELLKKYLIDSDDEVSENFIDPVGDVAAPIPIEDLPISADIAFVDCGPTASIFVPPKGKVSPQAAARVSVLKKTPPKFSDIPSLEALKKSSSGLNVNVSEKRSEKINDKSKSTNVVSKPPPQMIKSNVISVLRKNEITTAPERGVQRLPPPLIETSSTMIAGKSERATTTVTTSSPSAVLSNVSNSSNNLSKIPPLSDTSGKLVIPGGTKIKLIQIPCSNLTTPKEAQNSVTNNIRTAQIPQLLSPALKNRQIHLPRSCLGSDFQNNANLHCLENGPKGIEILLKKYQLEMRKKLLTYSKQKIQTIINTFSEFCRDFSKSGCVDLESMSRKNLATLKSLTGYLETASNDPVKNQNMDQKINNDFKSKMTSWEYQKNCYLICPECKKKIKPKKYLPGISKPSTQEDQYCQCSNFICHLCKAKQGSENRYKEHLKFHKNQAPYTCPECFTVFPNMQNLEIHIWTKCFHLNTQEIYACRVCEMEGFLTMEALSKHYYETHTTSVLVCDRCPVASTSYFDHIVHCSKDHSSAASNPETLIICDFGGCLVSPENFKVHLESHREIGKIQYYTCPFCAFFIKNVKGNENIIQDHVFGNHRERLCEVITPETLNFFASYFNLKVERPITKQLQVKKEEMLLPKIVNSCSIAKTAFESHDEPKIRSPPAPKFIRLNALPESLASKVPTGVTIPKIVKVQSIKPSANGTINFISNQSITSVANKPVNIIGSQGLNSGTNKIINVISNQSTTPGVTKPINVISSPKLTPLTLQAFQSPKFFSKSYLPGKVIHQRPIMMRMNLFDKNSNQLDNKKILARTSNSTTPISTISVNSVLTAPRRPSSPTENPDNFNSTAVLERSVDDTSQANAVIGTDEMDKLSDTADKFDIEEIIEIPVENREIQLVDHAKLMRKSAEALRRKGRPKKAWRMALDGVEDANSQPLNFKCHLCYENITTSWEVLKHHFATKHYREFKLCEVTPRLEKIPPSAEEEEVKVECKKRKLEPSSPRGASRRKRRGILTKTEDNSRSGICVTQEKLEQVDGNFQCKKCEELFADVKLLREHFANKHRIKEHFLVCLECGANFVVANSLQMHLKAYHGILDPVSYLAQNSLYAPDIGGFYDARTSEPNQCYVCMAVFEDKSAVDKHLRVHGMAFLNHTKAEARNAQKIDEKKSAEGSMQEVKQKSEEHNGDKQTFSGNIVSRLSMLLS
ncbi:uncharacterized protein LOC107038612 [Diachasma alloeum]|uniref:uncharacterized protein LOC107038612 n=1 Tax=Diachasma alloeum TaxID=454923 RepID=UPI0007383C0C|nr:uncharacterized protein LOC107038612 [Diachasma alloeum]XP_015113305.1 uncharacterized protein LOC107038612 [Diachasma alloeum]